MAQTAEERIQSAVRLILDAIGENKDREGLRGTPERVGRAWEEWTQGYWVNPKDFVTTFGKEEHDQLVLMKDINFYSHCEHHLTPFFGVAHVAYLPDPQKLLGISKLGRIVDMYAQRLQIQERMTVNIADCIKQLINPLGVAVIVEARHLCTESRGLKKHGQSTITSAMTGVFRQDAAARNELMLLIKG